MSKANRRRHATERNQNPLDEESLKHWTGVVADGKFAGDGTFLADTILAKHDERYMPPQVAGAMHKSESLKK